MAKRPRNLWKRPGTSFRIGQAKPVSSGAFDEQRLTLYLPNFILDQAESLANREGTPLQEYCARLLRHAIEDARQAEEADEADSRRRSLEGYHELTRNPEFLVEWNVSTTPLNRPEIQVNDGPGLSRQADAMPEPSPAVKTVLRHAAVEWDDASGFLSLLRRGESVTQSVSFELLQALNAVEIEFRDAKMLERRLAYALHRLAFEGQVLHTEAWSGVLDQETINLLRSVQEAVDRILSGEDIRYYPTGS